VAHAAGIPVTRAATPVAGPRSDRDATAGTSTWPLRINPLPRRRLADPRQAEWLGQLATLERELAGAAGRSSDELYQRIGQAADGDEKRALIALRRAIHNGRIPAAVPADPGPGAARWLELARSRAAVIATVEDGAGAALARERAGLAESLRDEDFQRSLALVAPEVHAAAVRYADGMRQPAAAGAAQTLPSSLRKSERGLLQYLTRAMIRTSPLTRFTAVGLCHLDPAGIRLDQVEFTGATPFVTVDLVMFNYVAGGLVAETAESATEPGPAGADEYIQPSPQLREDPDGTKVIFTREVDGKVRVRAVPLTAQVELIIELTSLGPRRLSAVARDLAERAGGSAESAASVLRKLLAAGLLVAVPGPEEITPNPLGEISLRVPPEQSTALLSLMSRLDRAAAVPAAERPAVLADIGAITTGLSRAARRPALLQVDEDYIVAPHAVSTAGYRGALRDLGGVIQALSVYDRLHDFRALLTAAFVERFGAGASVDLSSNAKELMTAVYRRFPSLTESTANEIGPGDGSLATLFDLRRRLSELVRAEYARHAGEPEIDIPAADLAAVVADLPARFRADPLSYGVLVQPWRGSLVFNDALAGHGILFGRFLGADRRLGGRAGERHAQRVLARYGAGGVRVAEDRGLHRLNVNARPPILDDRMSPDDWYDLRLGHDADTDQLWILDPDGRRTRVLTFGTGHPELYPPPLRIATWLTGCARVPVPFPDECYGSTAPDRDRTWSFPRLRSGGVILSRRRWYGHEELDQAVAARGDAERLTALARWRAAHEVPEEVVVKTPMAPGGFRPGGGPGGGRSRRDKPQYVDLSSGLFARVLPRLLERRGDGYLEEALPRIGDSAHVYEWVVEASRPAFGDFTVEEA
jgi:hypothetical protein